MEKQTKKWLNLPEKYDLVTGDTFELFYRGIILANNPYVYRIQVDCPKGAAYRRKFMYTPTEAEVGIYPLQVSLYDDYDNLLDRAEVSLSVNPPARSPERELCVLCVGASQTAPGIWPAECFRRLCGTGGEPAGLGLKNIRFVGGRQGDYGIGYEGYGGWRFSSYNTVCIGSKYFKYIYADHGKLDPDRHSLYTDGVSEWKLEEIEDGRIKVLALKYSGDLQPSGVLHHVSGGENHSDIIYTKVENASGNPFWNHAENRVDYRSYAERIGAPSIDICALNLGWNSFNRPMEEIEEETRIFIENLHRDYPRCRILLPGPATTASQDALGTNYGTSWNYYEKLSFAFRLDALHRRIAESYDFVRYTNTAGQFDSEYNYPTAERKANARSSHMEIIQTNGLHPTGEGYLQLADIYFRAINAMLLE